MGVFWACGSFVSVRKRLWTSVGVWLFVSFLWTVVEILWAFRGRFMDVFESGMWAFLERFIVVL